MPTATHLRTAGAERPRTCDLGRKDFWGGGRYVRPATFQHAFWIILNFYI